ncbi:MAG TPA: hypothetical protein VGE01_13155 [Fimbriimonas sp.]
MRLLFVLLFLVACLAASGQEAPERSLFTTVRPQATVVVRKHSTGSEVVIVTMLDPKYPKSVLKAQAEELAGALGQSAQGLTVYEDFPSPESKDIVLVRAQFGVTGLSDAATGTYRLQPIVRAFAGASDPNTIEGLAVIFEEMPVGKNTVRRFDSDAVAVELSPASGRIGVEYRILIKDQNPAKIEIPESRPEARTPVAPKTQERTDWIMIVLAVIAALALGALVYSLLLRVRPQSGSAPR